MSPARRPIAPVPEEPILDLHDPEEGEFVNAMDLVPDEAPESEYERDTVLHLETDRYIGSSYIVTIGAPLVEVNFDIIKDQVISVWRASGQPWCQVQFLLFRYIPYNPIYKGEMLNRQGTWIDFGVTTQLRAEKNDIENGIDSAFDLTLQKATYRVIWLEHFRADCFTYKEDLRQ